ncbi:hypothetical protein F3N42_10135 [Marinihelvus fidelis]|uniref:DUF481 domain-containing protein n=1 Tax=Marinihelvus fidelis TaxID=2613842 RepID=A0A5N0TA63_9GAMM|nr:hypothetical protein [Marinihelvus fidelis]KAA9131661.1 hypothetical protein F3N42_10135 [Marinihelvus fidelis]
MSAANISRCLVAIGMAFSSPLLAQSNGDLAHPALSSTFELQLGAFFPNNGLELQANLDDSNLGDLIDFNKVFGVDKSDSTFALDFRWRFGEKWSVSGQYWDARVSGRRVLEEDITWEDLTLESGSFAEAGVDTAVMRVFFGREFMSGRDYEFGAGLGFHWMEIEAYIQGEVKTNVGGITTERRDADVGAPLPNIGAWYIYAPNSTWAVQARVDWLSASFDEYSGSLFNSGVMASYQFTDNVGLGLSYNYFELDVDVDDTYWNGGAEIRQHGPFVSLILDW